MFLSSRYCDLCGAEIDKNTFPMRGNVCLNCEVTYNVSIATTKKGSALIMGRKENRDYYAAAKGSGHFPLTFNFVRRKDGRKIQCSYCGKFVHYKEITRDHIYPKSKGGLIKTPACKPCNESKEDMLPIDWAIYTAKHGIDVAIIPLGMEDEEVKEYLFNDIFLLLNRLLENKEEEDFLTAVA